MIKNQNIACIYPGRFQMPHSGHARTFNRLTQQFDTVFVAMTNHHDDSNSDSPFTFFARKQLLQKAGIPAAYVAQVKNPYRAEEICSLFTKDTVIVFAVGEKDRSRFGEFGPKIDGTEQYLQPFYENRHDLKSQEHHAYVTFVPTESFAPMDGDLEVFTSSTELRNFYRGIKGADERRRFAKELYGDELMAEILDSSLALEGVDC